MTIFAIKRAAGLGLASLQRLLTAAGLRQSDRALAADAQRYWDDPADENWAANSHFRAAMGDDLWLRMGKEHLAVVDKAAGAVGFDRQPDTVLDWGCGGGANAVALASRCERLIGLDVSRAALAETERQLRANTAASFQPVRVDVGKPEAVLDQVDRQSVDLIVSFYVFELIPSPAYGERLLRIMYQLLAPGGMAVIQIKYATGFGTTARGWGYRRGLAEMTTYRAEVFWQLAEEAGFADIALVNLVARNELDSRYAYFALKRP
ncbi:SAM-dependent methyltransferase [Prauserella sp. PE36]|uniref:class I SAM-dependent methyltransferase n=1 Tax=Prauserella sp. PE36 TaxID=1504709 RepID=UPI000DE37DD1|nr:class I SAM-dependent methyltransferase [Prauserella sp. PE36]RBM21589.1 SAM-dependent methyltransferase [Prauserella sp. PE36]